VRVCVRACVRARVRAYVHGHAGSPAFLDGVSPDGYPYRIYQSTTNALWMYAEAFFSQEAAAGFCHAAGGTLAFPVTPHDQYDALTILNATVLAKAANIDLAHMPGTSSSSSYPVRSAADRQFGMWMGVTVSTTTSEWRGPNGEPVPASAPWGFNLSDTQGDASCSILLLTRPPRSQEDRPLIWSAWPCTGGSGPNDPLPALCKLPAIGTATSAGAHKHTLRAAVPLLSKHPDGCIEHTCSSATMAHVFVTAVHAASHTW
jgi:hypothetical protein